MIEPKDGWRNLLVRYMRRVMASEGVDFVEIGGGYDHELSEEDKAVLKTLYNEVVEGL